MNWFVYIGGWYFISSICVNAIEFRKFSEWWKCPSVYFATFVWIWVCWKYIH